MRYRPQDYVSLCLLTFRYQYFVAGWDGVRYVVFDDSLYMDGPVSYRRVCQKDCSPPEQNFGFSLSRLSCIPPPATVTSQPRRTRSSKKNDRRPHLPVLVSHLTWGLPRCHHHLGELARQIIKNHPRRRKKNSAGLLMSTCTW